MGIYSLFSHAFIILFVAFLEELLLYSIYVFFMEWLIYRRIAGSLIPEEEKARAMRRYAYFGFAAEAIPFALGVLMVYPIMIGFLVMYYVNRKHYPWPEGQKQKPDSFLTILILTILMLFIITSFLVFAALSAMS